MGSNLQKTSPKNSIMFRRVIQTSFRRMSDAETGMVFSFASPSTMLYNKATNVLQVDLPTQAGMIGVLPHHVPSLGNLAPGWATVMEAGGSVNKYFVSSGSFTINEDGSVLIAAEEAVGEDEIDLDSARKELANAQAALAAGKSEAEKAEAQVAIETIESMLK